MYELRDRLGRQGAQANTVERSGCSDCRRYEMIQAYRVADEYLSKPNNVAITIAVVNNGKSIEENFKISNSLRMSWVA